MTTETICTKFSIKKRGSNFLIYASWLLLIAGVFLAVAFLVKDSANGEQMELCTITKSVVTLFVSLFMFAAGICLAQLNLNIAVLRIHKEYERSKEGSFIEDGSNEISICKEE